MSCAVQRFVSQPTQLSANVIVVVEMSSCSPPLSTLTESLPHAISGYSAAFDSAYGTAVLPPFRWEGCEFEAVELGWWQPLPTTVTGQRQQATSRHPVHSWADMQLRRLGPTPWTTKCNTTVSSPPHWTVATHIITAMWRWCAF